MTIRYKCGIIRLTICSGRQLRHHFPKRTLQTALGERVWTRQVLEGSFGYSNTGAQWHMLPQCYPNYKTVRRRFQTWCRSEDSARHSHGDANELRERGMLDEEECFIDATFVMAKGGGAEVGPTKRGKGIKSHSARESWIATACRSRSAARREPSRSAPRTIVLRLLHDRSQAENLISNRAYDIAPLDHAVRQDGIEIIRTRSNRTKPPTQDRRRLRRFCGAGWSNASWPGKIQWQRRNPRPMGI